MQLTQIEEKHCSFVSKFTLSVFSDQSSDTSRQIASFVVQFFVKCIIGEIYLLRRTSDFTASVRQYRRIYMYFSF